MEHFINYWIFYKLAEWIGRIIILAVAFGAAMVWAMGLDVITGGGKGLRDSNGPSDF